MDNGSKAKQRGLILRPTTLQRRSHKEKYEKKVVLLFSLKTSPNRPQTLTPTSLSLVHIVELYMLLDITFHYFAFFIAILNVSDLEILTKLQIAFMATTLIVLPSMSNKLR